MWDVKNVIPVSNNQSVIPFYLNYVGCKDCHKAEGLLVLKSFI